MSGSSVVGRSARRQRPFGLGRLFLSFFELWSSRQPTRSVHECVDAASHGLLGAVVVVVATLFQGVGVEAPRAAALRRRAAEAPLVVARQALAGAERAARASHHLEVVGCGAAAASLSFKVQRTDLAAVVVH